jgi:GH15 family glucan-1,4-alpha-glucosidase
MGYIPIDNYGIIGNMRTVALVGMNGSVDWYCYPSFDSPSIFGAILDDRKGGRFKIHAEGNGIRYKQFYWPNTNILITRFYSPDGIVELEDFMPVGMPASSTGYHDLFRRLRCVRGSMRFTLECRPAFDYGRKTHRVEFLDGGVAFRTDSLTMALATELTLRQEEGGVFADFTLEEGQCQVFLFKELDPGEPLECLKGDREPQELFECTVNYWRKWLSACNYRGRWREQIYRSALVLKLMTYEPTGAIVAAPTCSLPEVIGGIRNWDYRYTWMRDAAFTVYAFLRLGFTNEARGFMEWIQKRAANRIPPDAPAPIMLSIRGDANLEETILSHWEGYRGSAPVRVGNGAYNQFQNDIYGELLDALYLSNKYVAPIGYDVWIRIRQRLNWICKNWKDPDAGIWEIRGRLEQFTYSKVMNWVALDRGIRLADKRSLPSDREHWAKVRDQIYEEVMQRAWNEEVGAFTQVYDRTELDASLLIMPLVFFMAPNDPRMVRTLDAILKSPAKGGLVSDGLVLRYPPGSGVDKLPGEEGTFNMCSFWLVEALTRAGATDPDRLDQARLLFERMLGFANHLGLYAEQTSFEGQALGNFPQAFTHLALISAAFNLDRNLGNRP